MPWSINQWVAAAEAPQAAAEVVAPTEEPVLPVVETAVAEAASVEAAPAQPQPEPVQAPAGAKAYVDRKSVV